MFPQDVKMTSVRTMVIKHNILFLFIVFPLSRTPEFSIESVLSITIIATLFWRLKMEFSTTISIDTRPPSVSHRLNWYGWVYLHPSRVWHLLPFSRVCPSPFSDMNFSTLTPLIISKLIYGFFMVSGTKVQYSIVNHLPPNLPFTYENFESFIGRRRLLIDRKFRTILGLQLP